MVDRIPVPLDVEFCRDPRTGLLPAFEGVDVERYRDAVAEIVECILTGLPIPERYYRKTTHEDALLRDRGWFHLHPGPEVDNDVLLIVEVRGGLAILIGLTRHTIFREVPKGRVIKKALGRQIEQIVSNWQPSDNRSD